LARAAAAALVLLALATGAVGCGGDEGVAAGATVRVYVSGSACPAAKRELARVGGRAGDVHISAVCLAATKAGGRPDLAAIGADARRASEDSAAIAYLEAPDPAAARFAQPILESAGIGWIESRSGAAAMRRVLRAVDEADSGSLRDKVRANLEAG
jgi:hypothetical protein